MTTGTAPCWGWVLPATRKNFATLSAAFSKESATELIKYLKLDVPEEQLNKALCEDGELFLSALDWLVEGQERLTIRVEVGGHTYTAEVSVWHYDADNGDVYDDLESGEYYFIFDHKDLFAPAPLAKALKTRKLMPEEKGWTNFS